MIYFPCSLHLHLGEENSSESPAQKSCINLVLWIEEGAFMCLCELVKRQRRMSRKGTRGYTIPSRTAQTLREKSAPRLFFFLPPFCYQYILLNMKSLRTNCASDLKCHKTFLDCDSEVK